jgi:Tfp pilus assembly protein PilE
MVKNTDGIKISIKEEAEEPAINKTAPKSKPNLKPKLKPKKKPSLSKNKVKTNKGGLIKLLTAMVIPAILVGVGIYVWQQGLAEETISSVRQEALETESSFEERLRNLKNSLTGVQDENQKLKEQTEAMNKRIALLDKAKIDFSDNELGVSFAYPAVFGEVVITTSDVASGTKFIGTFSDNDKLIFGGVSPDLVINKTEIAGVSAVTDSQGFEEERNKYSFLASGESRYDIEPAEVLNTASGKEALLIDKNSFEINPEADGLPVDIGGNVAVLVNLNGSKYKGMAIMNSDFGMMPLESFKQMIGTIKN